MSAKRVVLAEFFTSDEVTLLFVGRADFEQPVVFEINKRLAEIRDFVRQHFGTAQQSAVSTQVNPLRSLDEEAFHDFFSPFLAPLLAMSPVGDPMTDAGDIVWLVPHDVLHYLPLHAVRITNQLLIERNPVCYTPSASVMKYCHDKRKGRRARALVFGDSRNDLLYARDEARLVAHHFQSRAIVGGEATKTHFQERLARDKQEIDILHLACHGYFDRHQALQSGIQFAPEPLAEEESPAAWTLTAENIFSLEMKADLVTLSACESGLNERHPGDELIGLTRALIYAGTPSVVVSLWAVEDLSTGLLMQQFYRRLVVPSQGADPTKAEALQQAQLYVKQLTATELIAYCEGRLASLDGEAEVGLRVQLLAAKGRFQTLAGDFAVALITYGSLQGDLLAMGEAGVSYLTEIERAIRLIEFKSQVPSPINYDVRPFSRLYYWAPFILIGDWH